MIKFKKLVATGMVATMVVGSCMTAFAANNEGGQTGDGANEGHVDKDVVDFVLPTTTATTFKYTMDPERLITATDAAKYEEGSVFPDAGEDTGVYFLTGDKTYENASTKVQLINKGAIEQKVTVTAQLTAGDDDIAILTGKPAEDADTAGLYLAGTVAGVEKALSVAGVTWNLKVPGNDDNYEITWDGTEEKYVYTKIASGLTPWKAADIIISGAVTNGIPVEDNTTAPQLSLTWKFENVPKIDETEYEDGAEFSDVSDTPAATAMAGVSYNNECIYVRLVAGENADASKITSVKVGNDTKTATVAGSGAIQVASGALTAGTYTVTIVYDGITYEGSVTIE